MSEEPEQPYRKWRGSMLLWCAVFCATTAYMVSQIPTAGQGAYFGTAFFGMCALLAFLRARNSVD